MNMDRENPKMLPILGRFVQTLVTVSVAVFIFGVQAASASVPLDFQRGHCDSTPDELEFCRHANPKDWRDDEKVTLSRIVNKYDRLGLHGFFERAAKGGKIQLQRFATSAEKDEKGVWSSARIAGWISREPDGTFAMNLSDAFFEVGPDPISGISRLEFGIIHEIAHLVDLNLGALSSSKEFLDIAGWNQIAVIPTFKGLSQFELQSEFAQLTVLARAGRLQEAVLRNRQIGIAHGMPTLYSMTSPMECFAELIAYIVVESDSKKYINSGLYAYISDLVFEKDKK